MRSSDRAEPNKKKRSKCDEYNRYIEDDETKEGSIMWSIVMTCVVIIATIRNLYLCGNIACIGDRRSCIHPWPFL